MAAKKHTAETASPDTMRYWLGRTLGNLRQEKGIGREEIRLLIPGQGNAEFIDISTISRFEAGKTWPVNVDAVVTAYAFLCGIEDPRKLWERAVGDYSANGATPTIGEISPGLRTVMLALEAAQRTAPYDGESQGKPTSTQRRRATGG